MPLPHSVRRRSALQTFLGLPLLGLATSGLRSATLEPRQKAGLTAQQWADYQRRFVRPEGRVVDSSNGGVSHSEGQGYGLLLAWAAQDRETFERIWQWTKTNLRRDDGLFGWRWRPPQTPAASPVIDWNNASDGDLLIAWALGLASEAWRAPSLLSEALAISQRIREGLIYQSSIGPLLLPGQQGFITRDPNTQAERVRLNLSYWVFPALQALDRFDPNPVWMNLQATGLRLIALSRYGRYGLPPDWLDFVAGEHFALPSDPVKARFSYDAIRIPLYLCWAGLREPALREGMASLWSTPLSPAWVGLADDSRSAFPAGPLQLRMLDLSSRCLNTTSPAGLTVQQTDGLAEEDYYGRTLVLLADWALRGQGLWPKPSRAP